jgi:iron complex outermembrane recepter protein
MGSIKTQFKHVHDKQMRWPSKKRALAVAVASAFSVGSVLAQDDTKLEEEIIVTGIRQNLMNAQSLKYNADTVMDSITAQDMGSFPDKSIAEALQRVSGVTVNRFAASGDTAHFSAEPSGVVVRGLNQVRTEFNGRDTFSANSSRGLSWGDVSPELMSGVDTYKNQMAELIEGGIAGTVNMRTRVPFDQEGQMFAVSMDGNYGDLSEEVTPEASVLYSNRWDTGGGGEMGILANFAYSEVNTRTEGIQLFRMNRFRDIYEPDSLYYIPAGVNFRDNLYDRERTGASLAFQWADASDKLLFTTQFNRSEYENAWEEYLVQAFPADLSYSQSVLYEVTPGPTNDPNAFTRDTALPVPAPGTDPFTFDSRGLFQTGVMTRGVGWWGGSTADSAAFAQNAAGEAMVIPCYNNNDNGWDGVNACTPSLRGIDANTTTRSNNNRNLTQDLSFNLKWQLSDTVRSNFDLQFVDSEVKNYDIEVGYNTFANAAVDLSGEHPRLELMDPINVNQSPGGFANPNNYYIRHIMDHVEDSEGQQLAFRTDFEFDIDTSDWIKSVKVGARFAERDQDIRWTTYNWQNVANTWTGDGFPYWNLDRHDPANGVGAQPNFSGYPQDHYTVRTFNSDFYGGGLLTPNNFVFANMDLLRNQQLLASTMGASGLGFTPGAPLDGNPAGWDPICSNIGDRGDEVEGTCFTPAEFSNVTEDTQALYVQLNYGGSDAEVFGIPVSGNLGVRFVRTQNRSTGGLSFPTPPSGALDCAEDGNNAVPFTIGCFLTPEEVAYMTSFDQVISEPAGADHEHVLPSFNAKFELTDELLLRFAASKAMARPDMGNLRNYVGLSATLPRLDDPSHPLWTFDDPDCGTPTPGNPEPDCATVRWTGSAQNPNLKPIIATQFDLALEWYFAEVGSLTVTLFDKNFDDYIQIGRVNMEFTNEEVGQTRVHEISMPLNGSGAGINGYEVAFQRFFDFLPAPFDGFGVQLNYTHINNEGIKTTNVTSAGGGGSTITDQAPDQITVNRLDGLSDDAYTVILMYDKNDIEARLAYSWRSEYMVTAIDCCVAYPIWNDDYGQVDGSITWHVSDNFDVHLQGSNLTNSETKLFQQVNGVEDGGLLLPNAWFQNDRRYTFGFRFRY